MTEPTDKNTGYPVLDDIRQVVEGVDDNNPLDIEISVTEDNRVFVFHDKPFKQPPIHCEFDLGTGKLDFFFEGGHTSDVFGMPLAPGISKYMQNAHQILMVLMNDETGDANEGQYVPLIIHHSSV